MTTPGDSTTSSGVDSVDAGDTAEDAEPPPSLQLGPVLQLEIAEHAGDWSAFGDIERLIETAAAALAGHPRTVPLLPGTACVALSSDAEVRALNRRFRAKDQPTNVLSFPAPSGLPDEDGSGVRPLGDVILAAETLEAEAADLGIPRAHHLQHLVVHGLLHLLGFDHEQSAMAEEMEAIEIEVLAGLGVPNPYTTEGQPMPPPAPQKSRP